MPGASVARLEDGRMELTVSQSWINTFLSCPELARRELEGEVAETFTPEAQFGTALHAGVEALLNGRPRSEAQAVIREELRPIKVPQEGHKWSKVHLPDLAFDCLDAWERGVVKGDKGLRPRIAGRVHGIEYKFKMPVYDKEFRIVIQGTTDLVTTDGLYDWKFSARRWQQWEVQRYNIQSTMYVLGVYGRLKEGVKIPFRFGVVNPDNFRTEIVEVYRSSAHILALLDQLHSIAVMVEAGLPRWPLAGTDWRCSKKWCPVWESCRGAHGLDY